MVYTGDEKAAGSAAAGGGGGKKGGKKWTQPYLIVIINSGYYIVLLDYLPCDAHEFDCWILLVINGLYDLIQWKGMMAKINNYIMMLVSSADFF